MSDDVKTLSWHELAQALGVTRQSLVNWRGMEGAPEGRDVEEWKKFMAETGLGLGKGKAKGQAELREEKLKWETELVKARVAREHRKVIDREEVNRLLLHIATRARTMLYQFLETEAPPKLDGMTAAQMRPILREMADSIADEMAGLVERFDRE